MIRPSRRRWLGVHGRVPGAGLPEIDGPLGGVAPDCRSGHPRKLLARVSVLRAGGIVDEEEALRLGVDDPHRLGVREEQAAEERIAGLLEALALAVDPAHLAVDVQSQGCRLDLRTQLPQGRRLGGAEGIGPGRGHGDRADAHVTVAQGDGDLRSHAGAPSRSPTPALPRLVGDGDVACADGGHRPRMVGRDGGIPVPAGGPASHARAVGLAAQGGDLDHRLARPGQPLRRLRRAPDDRFEIGAERSPVQLQLLGAARTGVGLVELDGPIRGLHHDGVQLGEEVEHHLGRGGRVGGRKRRQCRRRGRGSPPNSGHGDGGASGST